jgi:hypothetical protein
LRKLFDHLLDNGYIIPIEATADMELRFTGADIRALMDAGDERWKTLVPEAVAGGFTP